MGPVSLEIIRERKVKKIDNLLSSTSYKRNNVAFQELCQELISLRDDSFNHWHKEVFPIFQANLRYVQKCSGLNQNEFCVLAKISRMTFGSCPYSTTFPFHTFLKCYSIMSYYLPEITLEDMFTIKFEQVYPWLKQQEQANRLKLGKDKRKTYTFKKK